MKFLRWFTKKPEEIQTINLSEVKEWVKTHTLPEIERAQKEIKECEEDIRELVTGAQKNLTILENAELQNKNVEQKHMQIMQGNRDNYLKQMRRVLGFLSDLENLETFQNEIQLLNIQKSYAILKEFFRNEVIQTGQDIKSLGEKAKKLQTLRKKVSLELLDEISELIESISKREYSIIELNREIQTHREVIERYNREKEGIMRKIKAVAMHEDYIGYQKTVTEREEVEKLIVRKEDEIIQLFAPLQKALKKYERIALNPALIQMYLNDPIQALESDSEVKIVAIISEMKTKLDALELKEDKKQKTLSAIEKIQGLQGFCDERDQLKKDLLIKKKELFNNTSKIEYDDLCYKQTHYDNLLAKEEDEIAKLQEKIAKQNPEEIITEIQEKVVLSTNKKVTIIDDRKNNSNQGEPQSSDEESTES